MTRWLLIYGCMLLAATASCNGTRPQVVVGSKKFTESVVLGEMLRLLGENAGASVIHYRELGGTTLVFTALENGEIDVYPEYTGTIAKEILGSTEPLDLKELKLRLAERGIIASDPLGFNNTYAIGMRRDRASQLGITKLSDIRQHPELSLGLSHEFLERADGWPAVRDRYQLPQRDLVGLDQDLAYRQLEVGAIDAMDVYSTDAKIGQADIVVLQDDLDVFPRYEALLLSRQSFVDSSPKVWNSLLRLVGRFDESKMMETNRLVELEGLPDSQVAAEFLLKEFEIANVQSASSLWDRLLKRTFEHFDLVRRSLFPAILIAIPLGIYAAKRVIAGRLIIGMVSIFQTIPSLALLVILIPPMAWLGLRSVGLGSAAAVVALILYSLLPIVRNTHAGLKGISRTQMETAKGLGLNGRQRLFSVELPLALPSILAGIKTAAVMNVGFATLGALIGAGGYGQPILSGIRLNDTGLILEGAIPAAILAIAVQTIFEFCERFWISPGLASK
jgi:osmoprotectant transport system permease protein